MFKLQFNYIYINILFLIFNLFAWVLDDSKRTIVNGIQDVNISREEIETVILYMQSWTQRQCSCCFRDAKNFERCNWALQVLIIVVVEILKNYPNPAVPGVQKTEGTDGEIHKTIARERLSGPKPLWDIEDKEKLIHFVSKIFHSNFPTYVAYKQHLQMRAEEVSQHEVQSFGHFCEINEPDVAPHLFRNVTLFCKVRISSYNLTHY